MPHKRAGGRSSHSPPSGPERADAYAIRRQPQPPIGSGTHRGRTQDRPDSEPMQTLPESIIGLRLHPRRMARATASRASGPALWAPLEPEVAFLLRDRARTLRHRRRCTRRDGSGCSFAGVVDSRIVDWKLSLPDTAPATQVPARWCSASGCRTSPTVIRPCSGHRVARRPRSTRGVGRGDGRPSRAVAGWPTPWLPSVPRSLSGQFA